MDRFDALRLFTTVIDTGGFSAAAARLGVTKSAVSRRVAELEDHLGARLLNRTTRRLALTDTGAAFYERAVRILADLDEAEQAASSQHTELRGRLRVAAPVSFGARYLGPALADFLIEHPRLQVDLDLNDRFVDLVEEGHDVAIRIGRLADSSLTARTIAHATCVACASPAYLERHGTPGHPVDLETHAGLSYANVTPSQQWRFRAPDGAQFSVKVPPRLCANNGDVLAQAACSHLGVAVLPSFIAGPALADGRLRRLLEPFEMPPIAVQAIYPHSRHLSSKVRLFVDAMKRRFGSNPPWERDLEAACAAGRPAVAAPV
ncbi:LysR family transcriptional regulator [Marinivivus vitaminiproducens]|uniref:LysR family transcriptional regulator n=1 Tax=Marinivivus vitaminiproducens TaxID=3035935 RepID=UPI0027A7E62F|nr:LysR family transcriptional regulator [Geminicoccaceae bacterium SCSIO 64248]